MISRAHNGKRPSLTGRILLLALLAVAAAGALRAQGTEAAGSSNGERLQNIENRLSSLESEIRFTADEGLAAFLCGAFCALWAQNSGRRPWLWFFIGFIFNFIAVIVVLYKNSQDRKARLAPPVAAP